jgi:hypothetical protein
MSYHLITVTETFLAIAVSILQPGSLITATATFQRTLQWAVDYRYVTWFFTNCWQSSSCHTPIWFVYNDFLLRAIWSGGARTDFWEGIFTIPRMQGSKFRHVRKTRNAVYVGGILFGRYKHTPILVISSDRRRRGVWCAILESEISKIASTLTISTVWVN